MMKIDEARLDSYLRKLAASIIRPSFVEFFQECGSELPEYLLMLAQTFLRTSNLAILYACTQATLQCGDPEDADLKHDLELLASLLLVALGRTGLTGVNIFNENKESFERYLSRYFYEKLDEAVNGEFEDDPNLTAAQWERQDEAMLMRLAINQGSAEHGLAR